MEKSNPCLVPISIVLAGIIIGGASAGAIIYSSKSQANTNNNDQQAAIAQLDNKTALRPIGPQDHVLGNPKAPVTVTIFSDMECPFCKRFQFIIRDVMSYYASSTNVAWVFRNFPLEQLHKKARLEATAIECAAELGGNETFWNYVNTIFEITPSNDGLDPRKLIEVAKQYGLDEGNFQKCVESNRFADKIQKDIEEAIKTGANGSPWTIITSENGKMWAVNGAQPKEILIETIEKALKEKKKKFWLW